MNAAYCDGPDAAAEIMASYQATYVLSSGGVLECERRRPSPTSGRATRFEAVYGEGGVSVWRLRGP